MRNRETHNSGGRSADVVRFDSPFCAEPMELVNVVVSSIDSIAKALLPFLQTGKVHIQHMPLVGHSWPQPLSTLYLSSIIPLRPCMIGGRALS